MTWTTKEFRSFCMALFGGYGWQAAAARALKVSDRTVRRWAAGMVQLPEWAQQALMAMAGVTDEGAVAWPRAEWIIGDDPPDEGGRRREYIVHTRLPRFIARLVEIDDDGRPVPGEGEADVTTGVAYRADPNTVICELHWIDRPPASGLVALMEGAANAIEAAGP